MLLEMEYFTIFLVLAICCVDVYSLSSDAVKSCTDANNKLRRLHENIKELQWDDLLAAKAQEYADKLIEINTGSLETKLIHEVPSNGLGENLYWRDNSKVGTCEDASLSWYNEINDYSYATAKSMNGRAVGHFTQVVWRNTVKFGVGIATMKSRKYSQYGNTETFIVAKYSPRGNIHTTGQRFEDYSYNVQPRKPGSVTPTINELKPLVPVNPNCENKGGDVTCEYYIITHDYDCDGVYASFFKTYCAKQCKHC